MTSRIMLQFLSRLTLMFDKSRGKDQHVDITMKRCKSFHDHMIIYGKFRKFTQRRTYDRHF